MLNFIAIVAMYLGMFFSFGQGIDHERNNKDFTGFAGAVLFGLTATFCILIR